MNEYIKAAIIGFWRSGATIDQICGITGLFQSVVRKIINEYKIKKPDSLPYFLSGFRNNTP